MNIPDMIRGIETQKIGALALDVFDKEDGIYHENRRDDILSNRDMAYLRQFPNVIMTQHMAFLHRCRRAEHGVLRHRRSVRFRQDRSHRDRACINVKYDDEIELVLNL